MNYLIEVASATDSFRVTVYAGSPEAAKQHAETLCRLLAERPGGEWRVNSVRGFE